MDKATLQPKTLRQAAAIQRQLQQQVQLFTDIASLQTVGAVDVSYSKTTGQAYGTLLVFRLPALKRIAVYHNVAVVDFPYVPGFLSFREIPVLLPLFDRLSVLPDLLLVDGQGIAHPRFLGIAAHLGVLLDIPTIGCAKSRLVGDHLPVGPQRGDYQWLIYRRRIVGAVLRSRTAVRPIYVSPGHRVSIPTAVELVLRFLGRTRIPEPIRQADYQTKQLRYRYEMNG